MDTLDIVTSCDFNNVFDSLVDLLSNEFINKLTTLMVQQVVRQERLVLFQIRFQIQFISLYELIFYLISSRSDNFTIALPLAKLIPLMDKSHQLIQSDHHIRSSVSDIYLCNTIFIGLFFNTFFVLVLGRFETQLIQREYLRSLQLYRIRRRRPDRFIGESNCQPH